MNTTTFSLSRIAFLPDVVLFSVMIGSILPFNRLIMSHIICNNILNPFDISQLICCLLNVCFISIFFADPVAEVIFWGAVSTSNSNGRILRSNWASFDSFAVTGIFPLSIDLKEENAAHEFKKFNIFTLHF
jgi:hypothetical protein